MFKKLINKDTDKDSLIQKNIIGSIILKATSILISFYLVRVAIGFVDETQYGIWLTLSSLIVWFNYFDIGLTHGFRNRFAETLARRDLVMAKIFVSTTYASLIIISILIMSIFLPINKLIDWCEILKINEIYFHELKIVVIILVITFAVSFFMQTISTIVTADQRPVLASLIQVSGQALSLLIICIAKYTIHKGNLIYLTLILTVSPLIILLISSLLLFNTRYKKYRPTFKCIRFKYLRDILGIGGKFFVIGVAMLFIFQ